MDWVGSYVLAGFGRQLTSSWLPRAGLRAGATATVASVVLLGAAGSVHDAAALNETRTLSFHHTHSNEDLTVTFKRDGRYDEAALKQLNHYLRDWRTQDETVMDRHLFDILWEVYRDVDGKQAINIISSYRSPATNAMLHRRSSGVARHSQHMLGHAMDFFIPGVALEQIRFAGLRLQRGGVGFYPTSGSPFVHLDTGNIRHWPRMTHDELARVFPDGRTVHIPSDGAPLKGYELAKAEIERRGDGDGATASRPANFLTALFKSKPNGDDEDESASRASAKPSSPVAAASARGKVAEPAPNSRTRTRVAGVLQLAAADSQIVPTQKAKQAPAPADNEAATWQSPADIINSRGFWDTPTDPKQATPAQLAALRAREALAQARASDLPDSDPEATSSVSPGFKALAYAPAAAPDRPNVIAAAAPIPRGPHAASAAGNAAPATGVDTVVVKGNQTEPVTNATRLSASKGENPWLRVVMLAPSASSAMSVTILGDTDLTVMRPYFAKPNAIVNMAFAGDPMLGLSSETFSGSATARLQTTSFVVRTAAR